MPPTPTALPNPNSKVHLLGLSNGYLVVAYNHSPDQRTPLSIALSRNHGRTWQIVGQIESDASLQFAYPTVEQRGSQLSVIYTVMKQDSAYRLICVGLRVATMDLKELS
uniref:Bnr asp-box repeat protein n=1 Tax=Tetraselmis sp. GSL018 TaxID=582737 RepID=A0A061SEG6_9CHLO